MQDENQSPINLAAIGAAQQLADEHDRRVVDLLQKHELWEEGVKFSQKELADKGYMLNQIMKPGNEYELVLAKIVEVVPYKAVVSFKLEVSDMGDTTLEDTSERRGERKLVDEPIETPAEDATEDEAEQE